MPLEHSNELTSPRLSAILLVSEDHRSDEPADDMTAYRSRNPLSLSSPAADSVVTKKAPMLLPPPKSKLGRKCLVLDLDETLVHSSFASSDPHDFTLTIDFEGRKQIMYVAKRPYVDDFLKFCSEYFELVVFTASHSKYAEPLLDILDPHKYIDFRLFRESCTFHKGEYVKDLHRIGRPLNHTIIVDNSPKCYVFNPFNAINCLSWYNDRSDNELLEILDILKLLADPSIEDVMKEIKILKERRKQREKLNIANQNNIIDRWRNFVKKLW